LRTVAPRLHNDYLPLGGRLMRLWKSAHLLCALLTAALPLRAVALDEPLRPLPVDLRYDPAKVALGAKLFQDRRFARDDSVSCASCHDLARGGADARPRSVGAGGAVGPVNSPTVYNSGLNFRQQWSGGAATLEDIVDRVVKSPKVFDTKWDDVLAKLGKDATLVEEFRNSYPDGLTAKNVMDAIAVFERTLVTPSRFDRYLRGEQNAITAEEKSGYERFKNYGCVACHQGVNVGGNMFQVFGAMDDYFRNRGSVTPGDLGRFNVTKREADKHVFKVPSLRNVELTAPYFHDASANTLEEAVEVMFRYQLGRTAPREDKALIVQFLKTLTGEQFVAAKPSSPSAAAPAAAKVAEAK
jgi:cytochrome c peroxidase